MILSILVKRREEDCIMAQDVKNDIKKAIQVNTIPLIAIMTAVTTVLTMFVKIPTRPVDTSTCPTR